MDPRRRRVVSTAAACLLALIVVVPSGAGATAEHASNSSIPAGAVSPSQASPGQSIFVSGSSWPGNTEVSVAVCGEEARHGSGDCDLPSSTIVGTDTNGVFGTQLALQIPPKPCPCVVQITALGGDAAELNIPVTVVGAPVVALPPLEPAGTKRPLTIEDAELSGGSWTAWFGAAATRTLVLRVRNTSGAPLNDPLMLVTAGRGSSPSEPQPVPVQKPFATGEARVIRVPVEFDAPSLGDYAVRLRVGAGGTTTTKTLGTSSYPWGLIVVALLILQGILLLIRNRVRARVASDEPIAGDPVAAAPALEGVVGSEPAMATASVNGSGDAAGSTTWSAEEPVPPEPIQWQRPAGDEQA